MGTMSSMRCAWIPPDPGSGNAGVALASGTLVLGVTPPGDSHVIVRASASTTRGGTPLWVRFDASASRAATGATLAFAWTFGDGSSAHGDVVEHTYTKTGRFRARVTVRAATQRATADVVIDVEGQGDLDIPSSMFDRDEPHEPMEVCLAMR